MIVTKMESSGGGVGYARKEDYEYEGTQYTADIVNGDTVTILDAGEVEQGTFGEQTVFKIQTRNGAKKANFNQSSINVLHDAFGPDTEGWKNREVKVLTKKGVFAGKKGIACYFVVDGWYLDDFGELTNGEAEPEGIPPF